MLFSGTSNVNNHNYYNQLPKLVPPPPPLALTQLSFPNTPSDNKNKKIDLTKIDQTKMSSSNYNSKQQPPPPPPPPTTTSSSTVTSPPYIGHSSVSGSPEFVSEFKTSISVGADFSFNDITVQLVDDMNNAKKLYIHCLRIVPVPERSVTLKSGQIVKVDLNYMNANGKFLKKELKREIAIPLNSDINTLESYLENGNLVIKCLLRSDANSTAANTPHTYLPKSFTNSTTNSQQPQPLTSASSRTNKLLPPTLPLDTSSNKLNQDVISHHSSKKQQSQVTNNSSILDLDNSTKSKSSNGIKSSLYFTYEKLNTGRPRI
jgi:hypothetical protein